MAKNTTPQSVKGRDGWRFVLRDPGQTIRVKDYASVNLSRATRGSGPHYEGVTRYNADAVAKNKTKRLDDALNELKAGRYIFADVFVRLCQHHDIKLTQAVFYKCMYMNELDVSIKAIRHKNKRGDYQRREFEGIFNAIQLLISKTI